MNPRVARDPYLAPVCARWGEGAALEAGWFDDGDPTDAPLDDVGWLCTPTAPIRRGLDELRAGRRVAGGGWSPVVLLSTGGFFPVHHGHLAMMEAARAAVAAAGRPVLGGYLSPAHDDYIAIKCGTIARPASTRLVDAAAMVAPAGWLAIDPWEAQARRVSVNYTDVAARLEAYLRHHVDPAIDVIYVCGGDNARFALAFTERGGCVVVGRPGAEAEVERWRADHRVVGNDRIRWVDGDDRSSSSAIRAGRPTPVRPAGSTDDARNAPAKRQLTLRLEDSRAVATLGLDPDRWRRFQDDIRAELASRVTLRVVTLEAQRAALAVSVASVPTTSGPSVMSSDPAPPAPPAPPPTISIDPMLPGDVDLGISRLFDLGGVHPLGHVARPGTPPLADQLAAIPPGTWILRDDDRATGSTIAAITARLPPRVEVVRAAFALDPTRSVPHDAREPTDAGTDAASDVADSRDFLLGTDAGGLVVALPDGSIGRAPYLLPYVDPSVRAGLPGTDAVAFSIATWLLGASVFVGTGLAVADLPPTTARTLTVAGFEPAQLLADVCHHHADVLRSFSP